MQMCVLNGSKHVLGGQGRALSLPQRTPNHATESRLCGWRGVNIQRTACTPGRSTWVACANLLLAKTTLRFKRSYDFCFLRPPPRMPSVLVPQNVLTHGLQALWLKNVITGKISLPPTGRMERAIELERAWKRSWMPPTSARASLVQLHMMKYHDQLVKDIGAHCHARAREPLF